MSGILAALFLGGGKVTLINDTSTSIVTHPSTALAVATLVNNGQVAGTDNSPYAWLVNGTPSAYEVMATLNSGSVSGTFGSWLNLGTSQSWTLGRTTIGTNTGSITLQIRPVGGSVLATATISFHAEVD